MFRTRMRTRIKCGKVVGDPWCRRGLGGVPVRSESIVIYSKSDKRVTTVSLLRVENKRTRIQAQHMFLFFFFMRFMTVFLSLLFSRASHVFFIEAKQAKQNSKQNKNR